MALRFIDGFEHYATADLLMKWTSKGGSPTIATSPVRLGTQALKINGGSNTLTKALDAQSSWVVGFAFYFSALPATASTILRLTDSGTTQVDLRLNPSGTLSVTRNGTALTGGTSTGTVNALNWHYVEFKVTIGNSISPGTCAVRVNAGTFLTVDAGQDVQNTANSTADSVVLLATTTGCDCSFADLYVCDGTGSDNTDFLGDCRVQTLRPDAAGDSAMWTPSAGSNYQCVDDAQQNGDSDYVSSSLALAIDLYNLDALSGSGTVKGVQVVLGARKDDAGTRQISPVLKPTSTSFTGTAVTLTTSFQFYLEIEERNPDTSLAWTFSQLNACQLGQVVSL